MLKSFLWKNKLAIVVCVLTIAFGIGWWALSNPGTTTIGENITVGSNLYVTGNVGIGTTTPGNKLHVEKARSNTISSGEAAYRLGGNDVYLFGGSLASSPYSVWMQAFRPRDDAKFPLVLNPSGGNVGIGTTSPSQKLDVSGQIHATGDICTDAGGGVCLSGFSMSSCPSGTTEIYNNLCIDNNWRAAQTMPNAANVCHSLGGRVCTYGELSSACKLGISGNDAGTINGKWIGNSCGDDCAFCGNGGTCDNFEGGCNKGNSRQFKCCYGSAGGGY